MPRKQLIMKNIKILFLNSSVRVMSKQNSEYNMVNMYYTYIYIMYNYSLTIRTK